MKTMKKLLISIMITIMVVYTTSSMFNMVYADYGKNEWDTGRDDKNYPYATFYWGKNGVGGYDWRTPWKLEFSSSSYSMHVNFATFVFNNIYCIQKDWKYENDSFYINYGINITGNKAELCYGSWDKVIGEWSCTENNIMAGIVSAGVKWNEDKSIGIWINGGYKTSGGDHSYVQKGIYGYWDDFEDAMNKALGTTYDWRF